MIIDKPTVWAACLDGAAFFIPLSHDGEYTALRSGYDFQQETDEEWKRRLCMTAGRIHSIESMGLVDGPGIRTVIFLQGCSLRCRFCHNPDTWEFDGGEITEPEQLVQKILRFRPYFRDNGGVTFSGGEPLMQPEFLAETLRLCKEEGIHTCIDTAGCGTGSYDEILKYTDLVLLDIKQIDSADYRDMTGKSMEHFNCFLQALKEHKTPVWIRQVVIPGMTDSRDYMQNLRDYISTIPNIQKVELLPYHLLGTNKYEVMGIPYSLQDVPAMDKDKVADMQKEFFGGYDHV